MIQNYFAGQKTNGARNSTSIYLYIYIYTYIYIYIYLKCDGHYAILKVAIQMQMSFNNSCIKQ